MYRISIVYVSRFLWYKIPSRMLGIKLYAVRYRCGQITSPTFIQHENHDIAIAMSPSRADPVLAWLGVFKYLNQSHCTVWGYLNI